MADGKKITRILLTDRPSPEIALIFSNPLELLIATILSAQCTDKRVNMVTPSLFEKYPTTKDYALADKAELESIIFSTGFYKNKARSIKNCCERIINTYGGYVPETMEELITLPGVGRKTANVVLAGAFGKQTIPVDTHVIRLSARLGLSASKNPDIIEQDLMDQIPKENWSDFSMALILHGREVCNARRPLCSKCKLFDLCKWPEKK
jgi:endonuclease-3